MRQLLRHNVFGVCFNYDNVDGEVYIHMRAVNFLVSLNHWASFAENTLNLTFAVEVCVAQNI